MTLIEISTSCHRNFSMSGPSLERQWFTVAVQIFSSYSLDTLIIIDISDNRFRIADYHLCYVAAENDKNGLDF